MKKFFSLICFLVTIISIQFINVKASNDLDVILNYDITITPNDDATLEMNYKIKWKVLDSSSEGPLTWVKIGVPNKYVSNLKSNVNNVEKINYYSDNGAYIAIYFKQNYYQGEIVDIDFSFHQDYIFNENGNNIEFRFNPGWFSEIRVLSYNIFWSKQIGTPIYSNYENQNDDYYIWSGSFDYNETTNVDVKYNKSTFVNANYDKQYSNKTKTFAQDVLPVILSILFILGFFTIVFIINKKSKNAYYSYRGFSGPRFYYWHPLFYNRGYDRKGEKVSPPPTVNNSGGGSSSGSHCACACACACAGGGRAGCSRKDFTSKNEIKG